MDCELGMTVGQLRSSMTEEEFVHFAAYHSLKGDREQKEMDKMKKQR